VYSTAVDIMSDSDVDRLATGKDWRPAASPSRVRARAIALGKLLYGGLSELINRTKTKNEMIFFLEILSTTCVRVRVAPWRARTGLIPVKFKYSTVVVVVKPSTPRHWQAGGRFSSQCGAYENEIACLSLARFGLSQLPPESTGCHQCHPSTR